MSIGTNDQPRSSMELAVSADGRYVAFTGGGVFLRDRQTGTTSPIGSAPSFQPSITADGGCVAYVLSTSPWSVVAYDRSTRVTEFISVDSAGTPANDESGDPEISADGRFVAFDSTGTNLVPGDTNGKCDVFVRDRLLGTTEIVSLTTRGVEANGPSYCPSISADGRFVAFMSYSTDMVPGDTNQDPDIFVRDRLLGITEPVSVGMYGQANWDTVYHAPSISADGRFVAFEWSVCDMCGGYDIWLRDRALGTTEFVSMSSTGQTADDSSYNPYVSPDGRYVVFDSDSTNLVQPDGRGWTDVYVRDRVNRTTERVSTDSRGRPGNSSSGNFFSSPHNRMSGDGRFVGFVSFATDLVPSGGSENGAAYVRDRAHGEHPVLCEPGVDGVLACPCANPPSSRGRGCDNSTGTGGARLSIGGGEYLSSDSLYITMSDALPNALCILMDGSRPNAGGAVFGQGVRCVGGIRLPLWIVATHLDGAVTVPDFEAGDPTVHQRAAEFGYPIQPMQSRWYQAIYRDPSVLGGCPASATFNATQAMEVLWLP